MTNPEYDVDALEAGERSQVQLGSILRDKEDFDVLREQIKRIDGDKVGRVAILSFRSLQLYRIAQLQATLVEKQNAVMNHSPNQAGGGEQATEMEDIDDLIQRYADTVRNYETLAQATRFDKNIAYEFLGGKQEFKVTGRKNRPIWDELRWLKSRGATVVPYGLAPIGFRELDKQKSSDHSVLYAFRLRVRMALFGSVALIVPMLIMALVPGIAVSLATTAVATLLFDMAFVVLVTDASGKDVLAWTAAYTAVLVVFVGASLPGGSGHS